MTRLNDTPNGGHWGGARITSALEELHRRLLRGPPVTTATRLRHRRPLRRRRHGLAVRLATTTAPPSVRTNYPDYDQALLTGSSYGAKIWTDGAGDSADTRTVKGGGDPAVGTVDLPVRQLQHVDLRDHRPLHSVRSTATPTAARPTSSAPPTAARSSSSAATPAARCTPARLHDRHHPRHRLRRRRLRLLPLHHPLRRALRLHQRPLGSVRFDGLTIQVHSARITAATRIPTT